MSKTRISTHRIHPDYVPVLEAAFTKVQALPPAERNMEMQEFHLRVGTLTEWNNGSGWQGVLRRIKTKGMDPATNVETGESRKGDHKPNEGQGAGAGFIYDRPNRVLAFYHGIPYGTHTMLLRYLHGKADADYSTIKISGIPKQGAIANFRKAKDIQLVQIPLDGEEARTAASAFQGFLWNAVEGLPSAFLSATLMIKIRAKNNDSVREQVEAALVEEFESNSDSLAGLRVTYRDAGGELRKNVDLRSELFVDKTVTPSPSHYLLDDVLIEHLNANYEMLLNEHPILKNPE